MFLNMEDQPVSASQLLQIWLAARHERAAWYQASDFRMTGYRGDNSPMDEKHSKRLRFLIDAAFYCVIGIIIFFVVKYTLLWALPFLLAFLSALILSPLIKWLNKTLKIPKIVSSIVLVLAFFSLLILLIVRLAGYLVVESTYLSSDLPGLIDSITSFVSRISGHLNNFIKVLPETYSGIINDTIAETLKSSSSLFSNLSVSLLTALKNLALSLPSVLIFIIATILSAIFVCSDFDRIKQFLVRQLPDKYQEILLEVKGHLFDSVFRLLRAYFFLLCITFIELCTGFLIIGIDYAVILAFIIALVDILPILGIGTVLIPWSLFSLIGGNYRMALSMALLYVIITAVRQILEPKIVGQNIGVNPLVTLMCIYVGFRALGVFGMFLFPVIFLILKKLQEDGHIRLWKRSKKSE